MNISDIKLTRSELNLIKDAIALSREFHVIANSSRDADEWLVKDFKRMIYNLCVTADQYSKTVGESAEHTLNDVL